MNVNPPTAMPAIVPSSRLAAPVFGTLLSSVGAMEGLEVGLLGAMDGDTVGTVVGGLVGVDDGAHARKFLSKTTEASLIQQLS